MNLLVGQILLENRWNLDLTVTMLRRIEKERMRCEECGVDFSGSVLNLIALLVERRPVWCKDLVKGSGMGRYSMLTVEMLEELFQRLLVQASTESGTVSGRRDAEMVVKIVDGFPEWESKAMDMRNRLGRVKEKFEEQRGGSELGFYGVYRPIEGLPFCLVPS